MRDTPAPPRSRFTRRALLLGLGGAGLAAPVLWRSGALDSILGTTRRARADAPCCRYIDIEGWMLTPADQAQVAGLDLSQ